MTGRVAIVASCRTPFAKAGEVFKDLSALDLAKVAVRELIERSEVDPRLVGTLVMGQVVAGDELRVDLAVVAEPPVIEHPHDLAFAGRRDVRDDQDAV